MEAQRESRGIAVLFFLTSALDVVGGQRHNPAALPAEMTSGNHRVGGWLGPTAGKDGFGEHRRHQDSIPGPCIR
jgi:hypothetical protein